MRLLPELKNEKETKPNNFSKQFQKFWTSWNIFLNYVRIRNSSPQLNDIFNYAIHIPKGESAGLMYFIPT